MIPFLTPALEQRFKQLQRLAAEIVLEATLDEQPQHAAKCPRCKRGLSCRTAAEHARRIADCQQWLERRPKYLATAQPPLPNPETMP